MSKIVLENFNDGNGYYKVNLAYLSKEQVEEIENLVSKWKPSDEDIKSCIGMCLTDANEQRFKDYGTNLKDCLAWLEKQGEQKSKNESTDTCDSLIIKSKEFPASEKRDFGYFSESADKIEPKFHEGEWITNGEYTWKIVDIKSLHYTLQSQDGNIVYDSISYVDEQFHSFTIEDAKDGDILVFNKDTNNDTIVIFKNLYNATSFHSYCYVEDGEFFISHYETPDWWRDGGFQPATKEQRQFLFQKMKDAGYEWDAEKKEPKKIKVNTIWSEEDYNRITSIKYLLHELDNHNFDDWFDSLKYKPQYNKPSWSEEDEKMLDNCINALGDSSFDTYEIEEWLKTIKERIGWKPSGLQIEALESVTENCAYSEYQDCLRELIKQLKKL